MPAGTNTSSAVASISIADPAALQASDSVFGFTVHLTAGKAIPGDRFLLQPVTLAAQGAGRHD